MLLRNIIEEKRRGFIRQRGFWAYFRSILSFRSWNSFYAFSLGFGFAGLLLGLWFPLVLVIFGSVLLAVWADYRKAIA